MYGKASITFRPNSHGGTVAHEISPECIHNILLLCGESLGRSSPVASTDCLCSTYFIISSMTFVVGRPQRVDVIRGRSQNRSAQKLCGREVTVSCCFVE